MPTPIREAVLAAVAARLKAQLAGVTVVRALRAPLDPRLCPAVILRGGDMVADEDQSFGETMWRIAFSVAGMITATSDLAAEQALSDLHAKVIAALQGYDLGPATIQPNVLDASFEIYSAEDSATPAGEFTAAFEATAMTPNASPYAA